MCQLFCISCISYISSISCISFISYFSRISYISYIFPVFPIFYVFPILPVFVLCIFISVYFPILSSQSLYMQCKTSHYVYEPEHDNMDDIFLYHSFIFKQNGLFYTLVN